MENKELKELEEIAKYLEKQCSDSQIKYPDMPYYNEVLQFRLWSVHDQIDKLKNKK